MNCTHTSKHMVKARAGRATGTVTIDGDQQESYHADVDLWHCNDCKQDLYHNWHTNEWKLHERPE